MSTYLLDHAWAGERERLDALSAVFDPGTVRVLEEVGVSAGWRCLGGDPLDRAGAPQRKTAGSVAGHSPGRYRRPGSVST